MTGMDDQGQNLIFIISQPRSGSTLLQRILGKHPSIHTTAEPWIMLHPVYALRERGYSAEYNATLATTALKDFLALLPQGEQQYYQALRQMTLTLYKSAMQTVGKTHFLDKTPRYYHILPELFRIFPEAKYIFLLRNPLAVLNSYLNTFVKGHWHLLARYQDDLVTAPQRICDAFIQSDLHLHTLHYEDLVRDPATQIRDLCIYLGLEYFDNILFYDANMIPTGHMGDNTGIQNYNQPSTSSLNLWMELGQNAQTRHLALAYLDALGADLITTLGYNSDELKSKINSVPCRTGQVEITWDHLFHPDDAMEKRLVLIELAVLQHRRIVHALQRWRKKLLP